MKKALVWLWDNSSVILFLGLLAILFRYLLRSGDEVATVGDVFLIVFVYHALYNWDFDWKLVSKNEEK